MKLISMLDEDLVLEHLQGTTRETLYAEMLTRLSEYAELELDVPDLTGKIIASEDNNHVTPGGAVLPHLRLRGLQDLFIVIGLPATPTLLRPGDTEPTSLVVMSLIADNMSDVYLKTIAALAKLLATPSAREESLAAARAGRDAFWNYLQTHDVELKKVVTAEDVMQECVPAIAEDAPLAEAFDKFNHSRSMLLAVLDAEGRLVGQLSALAVIKSFIPDYVFMMESVNFLNNFEVFNRIFSAEHADPVSRFMDREPVTAKRDAPLIQLTLQLAKREAETVFIVEEDGRLAGAFDVASLVHKVLRG